MPANRYTYQSSGSTNSQSRGAPGRGGNRGSRGAAQSTRGFDSGRGNQDRGSEWQQFQEDRGYGDGLSGGGEGLGGGIGRGDYTKYIPPTYRPDATLYFAGIAATWDHPNPSNEIDAAALDAPPAGSIKKIRFGAKFDIQDHHLEFLQSRPHLMASLEWLELGDSDTGHGGHLTNEAVQEFLFEAPKLRVLKLDACNALTDITLIRALDYCPYLELVRVTGHDKSPGNVRGPALHALKTRLSLGINLKELVLVDQSVNDEEVEELTFVRKGLAVLTGDTVDSGVTSQMVAATSGGGLIITYYDGRMADFDTDGMVMDTPYSILGWNGYF